MLNKQYCFNCQIKHYKETGKITDNAFQQMFEGAFNCQWDANFTLCVHYSSTLVFLEVEKSTLRHIPPNCPYRLEYTLLFAEDKDKTNTHA